MAVSDVKFVTGLSFAEGAAILSPLIQEIASQREAQVGLDDEAAKYGFTFNDVLTPSGEITSMIGVAPPIIGGDFRALARKFVVLWYHTKKRVLQRARAPCVTASVLGPIFQ